MAAVYELRIFGADGGILKRVSNFLALSFDVAVNNYGLLTVDLPTGGDTAEEAARAQGVIAALTFRCPVEVWRKDDALGIDWTRAFGGFYLKQHQEYPEASTFTITAAGYLWLLSTRVVDWPAGTANRTLFTGAASETMMKTLVSYNAGASALAANGRGRDGVIAGLNVQTDNARGNTQDWQSAGDNLLAALQKIQHVAGGDFDLVRTGQLAWEFRFYAPQRGTDRRGTVTFSLGAGNMGNAKYEFDRIAEGTVACVWGQGQGANRQTVNRTGANWSALADFEIFVDARDLNTTAALNARGDDKLWKAQAREVFTFDVLQTPSSQYGLHYFLGDIVTVVNPFTGAETLQKIMSVITTLDVAGAETLQVNMATP